MCPSHRGEDMVDHVDTDPRPCTDEEYNSGRRCWNCDLYSFKEFSSEDVNRGKCFALKSIRYVNGSDICFLFTEEPNALKTAVQRIHQDRAQQSP
jgi:hypothetical protein